MIDAKNEQWADRLRRWLNNEDTIEARVHTLELEADLDETYGGNPARAERKRYRARLLREAAGLNDARGTT